jgi:CheY-like chemotaxis protein
LTLFDFLRCSQHSQLRGIDTEIPVILSSGFDEELVQEHVVGLTTSGFLQKPYQIDALREALRGALKDA